MKTCLICDYHEARNDLISAFGSTPICLECFENQCENPVDIHRAYQLMMPERRPIAFRNVTCWAGPEVGYMPLRDFHDRITHQMLTVVDELTEEDEAHLAHMMDKAREIRRQIETDEIIKRLTKPTIVDKVRALFVAWFMPGRAVY